MSAFPCTNCGLCCRNMAVTIPAAAMLARNLNRPDLRFPHGHVDGTCNKLDIRTGRCTIYSSRPPICDLAVVAKAVNMPLEEFYRANAKGCEDLIRKAGLPDSYIPVFEVES